ncbi:hypothetical protein N7462_005369 [Penicillium macrosclerotiorum]|uniref:uncharacterized protein n=1 Tax=Penicillium macrosclerotiorum TaxID=303699 RepID=UPI002549BB33|nr:uncharacterized protein N7462_005369 [Penicillium macrosclerotiorum]KAJ5682204.1 hypothetical protein N7462_005369 [Penicillium macrosclerotiorum]
MNEKRRRKTGCLTCRTRRVKCDERKPTCARCEKANVECAGYAEKRRISIQPTKQSSSVVATPIDPTTSTSRTPPSLDGRIYHRDSREDGLPLIGLPVNPTAFQHPHSRARDMLGYHQYLFRTLPVLFPPRTHYFWRDFLCQAAWEVEWAFDTIVALGSMHRAALFLSRDNANDHDQGLDTKIVAIQTYIKALQGVSDDLTSTAKPTPLAVGVLVLMAYIEVCR